MRPIHRDRALRRLPAVVLAMVAALEWLPAAAIGGGMLNAANTANPSLGTSWTGGDAPGAGDVGVGASTATTSGTGSLAVRGGSGNAGAVSGNWISYDHNASVTQARPVLFATGLSATEQGKFVFTAGWGAGVMAAVALGLAGWHLARRRRRLADCRWRKVFNMPNIAAGVRTRACAAIALLAAGVPWSVQAEVIVAYDSGVAAAAGATGAADPSTQGWTYSGGGAFYADAYDSGNGGWRTVDGTTANASAYLRTLTGPQISSLQTADGWELTWTIALDTSALLESGGGVTDYYLAPNNGRQNDIYAILQVANSFNFFFSHRLSSSNEVQLRNENNTTQLFNTGIFIGNPSPFPNFGTFSLTYDPAAGTAMLNYGAGTATISNGANQAQNRVFFGAGSSAGQGSAIWNDLTVQVVPEPSTFALGVFGIGGVAAAAVRRWRR